LTGNKTAKDHEAEAARQEFNIYNQLEVMLKTW